MRKPEWLRKKIAPEENRELKAMFAQAGLHTICEEALCPNISECFRQKQASFLILGKDCTRQCRFCNVERGTPTTPDPNEPFRVAETIRKLGLNSVVITSPTRDDLTDGGAEAFAATVRAIRQTCTASVETLIPDFAGSVSSLKTVLEGKPDILSHNLETVRRLYEIRKGADYERSLELLKRAATIDASIPTKSGIMLGLGETPDEVEALMRDLLENGCRLLSVGQYLAPSRSHFPVQEYIAPKQFESVRETAMRLGFRFVESGPYVRSSYHAERYL